MRPESSDPEMLKTFFADCQRRVESTMGKHLRLDSDNNLHRAMAYATLNGGKRIRPILAYGAALAVGDAIAVADHAACAVELIHCYSLVHDDLPAMDNDDLRRGIPTVHKAFNEATAILAGDGLQSLAFEVLATPSNDKIEPATRLQMTAILARASGFQGMAAGQALDFEAVGKALDLEQLQVMHSLKTGALIAASVELGALSAPNLNEQQLAALKNFAGHIGLAFQIQDDILDVTADTATLGKPQGSDQSQNKPTYTSLLGLDAARDKARILVEQALADLEIFSADADVLRQLAHYIVQRTH